MPAISVIVPMRNEAETIARCLGCLLSQTLSASEYEIVVVDGMSEDSSADAVLKLQETARNLVLLKNPLCTMPTAVNIGLRYASSPVIMVAGAHTSYPSDYLEKCLRYLEETGADVVGGPLMTTPRGCGFAPLMVSAILSSRFGVGNAAFRTGFREGWVDTVPYPAYRKEIFERCGMYNETLVRAQDCELHARIRHNGGRIYQTPELTTHYHPVATFEAFWRKAFSDGKWQCYAVLTNPRSLSLRRFAPALMVMLLTALAVAAIIIRGTWIAIAAVLLLYLLAGMYFGSSQIRAAGLLTRLCLPFYAFPFHICYGMGTLAGIWDFLRAPAAGSKNNSGLLHDTKASR